MDYCFFLCSLHLFSDLTKMNLFFAFVTELIQTYKIPRREHKITDPKEIILIFEGLISISNFVFVLYNMQLALGFLKIIIIITIILICDFSFF